MMTATQARWETRNSFRVLLSDNGDTIYALSEDDNVTDAQMREIANAMQDMEALRRIAVDDGAGGAQNRGCVYCRE